ncbi:MAG: FliA/WhiG family RNA polymerase sigma factor [Candidatus Aureabacteria bacterium]|nr:FliA/WhiG family RNA polymerase sigma factor [Candidatus Auribacterota bacterium]
MTETEVKQAWQTYIKTRNMKIKNDLILHYLPVVRHNASRLALALPSHVNINDLISSGVVGLISSIEKFDPNAGFQFKSFASHRIQGAMLDELRNLDWIPRTIRSKSKKVQAAYNEAQQKHGRMPTDVEVAEYLGVSMEQFNELLEATKIISLFSFDARINPSLMEDSPLLSELIKDPRIASPSQEISREELKQLLIQAINELPKQEKTVLILYYYEELTLKEIGEVLGVTESRICQIHAKAIFKLKARVHTSEIKEYATH